MKALLLSGSLGMGHDVVAEACATSLQSYGWSTETVDSMRMLGPGGSSMGQAAFRGMLAIPGLFDALHFAALRPGGWPARLADGISRRKIVPRLRDYLDANPADLAISAFASGASAVSWLADRYPGMSHMVICTDVTPHRLWVHPHVDLYLVTSAVAEAAVRRYQPRARVLVTPGPVRPPFYRPPTQSQARAGLGVPADEPCVLLMSGGWGLGPVAAAAEALAGAGVHVLAVAGRNARLERRLRAAAQRQPRVRPFGFTLEIPQLMAAADLVVTGAGADTCLEARTIGRPLLLLDVLQGHGRDNLQHELELGNAWVTSAGAADVVRTAFAVLDDLKPPLPGPARSQAEWEAAFQSALGTLGLWSAAGSADAVTGPGLAGQPDASGSSVAISQT
jgi:processive 1,2-diacylglycerol beta-glucosyltransferase